MGRTFFSWRHVARRSFEHGSGATDIDAPWPLRLHWRCKRYGALPDVGGVLDQDDMLMSLMSVCVSAEYLATRDDSMIEWSRNEIDFYNDIMED